MSKQRPHAASRSCTGTMNTAIEEREEGRDQTVGPRTSLARRGCLQVTPTWDAQQVTGAYRDAQVSLSHSFFQA